MSEVERDVRLELRWPAWAEPDVKSRESSLSEIRERLSQLAESSQLQQAPATHVLCDGDAPLQFVRERIVLYQRQPINHRRGLEDAVAYVVVEMAA
jgi:hypothetical protein